MSADETPESIMRERSILSSVFLGPKAENERIIVELISDVLTDYIYWRKNFHPEDLPVIYEWTKREETFGTQYANFKQRLSLLLDQLKRNNVPFASTRYIGHMLSDQLLPAIVGYFAAMLYNPNNVTKEVSPKTTELEKIFIDKLSAMIGYTPLGNSWGHIASGGTVANLEALWVARNLKYLPISILMLSKDLDIDLKVALNDQEESISISHLWRLLNCDVIESLDIFHRCIKILNHNKNMVTVEAITTIENYGVSGLGIGGFFNKMHFLLEKEIKKEFPHGFRSGVIIVPSTAHYSLAKTVEILGLGRAESCLIKVPITSNFRMDIKKLKDILNQCISTKTPVIAVTSVCGSTEEGAIDPIDKVEDLRSKLKNDLKFFHHCDAAYGGYVRALFYNGTGEVRPEQFFSRVQHIDPVLQNEQKPWPSTEICSAVMAIKGADSVTIDPHKLGYVPYPAGAVVFKEKQIRDVIALRPGYLEEPLIGSYILEGSKPGAAAAACWLTSEILPLNTEGQGVLVRRIIKNAYALADALRELSKRLPNDVRLRVLNYPPDLNIVCFIFNILRGRGRAIPLVYMNAFVEEVYLQFMSFLEKRALSGHEYIVSKTELLYEEYSAAIMDEHLRSIGVDPEYFCHKKSSKWDDRWSDDKIFVLRCVVMNPWFGTIPRSENAGPGRQRVKVEELTFIWDFISKLQAYINHVGDNWEAIGQNVDLERSGARPREDKRVPRLPRAPFL